MLTGTANQITITDGGANTTVTLSLPQDIDIAASVQFGSLTVDLTSTLTGDVSTGGGWVGGGISLTAATGAAQFSGSVLGSTLSDGTANLTGGDLFVDSIFLGENVILPDGGHIGSFAGDVKIVFDDANNWLEITGNVGIGNSAPTVSLEVGDATGGEIIRVSSGGNGDAILSANSF
ncbi:hypothetical protein LCGC14_2052120, partial [marine sediment metagenome]